MEKEEQPVAIYTCIFCYFQSANIVRHRVGSNLSLLPSFSPPPVPGSPREPIRGRSSSLFHSPRCANGRIERASSQRRSARFLISPLPPVFRQGETIFSSPPRRPGGFVCLSQKQPASQSPPAVGPNRSPNSGHFQKMGRKKKS